MTPTILDSQGRELKVGDRVRHVGDPALVGLVLSALPWEHRIGGLDQLGEVQVRWRGGSVGAYPLVAEVQVCIYLTRIDTKGEQDGR